MNQPRLHGIPAQQYPRGMSPLYETGQSPREKRNSGIFHLILLHRRNRRNMSNDGLLVLATVTPILALRHALQFRHNNTRNKYLHYFPHELHRLLRIITLSFHQQSTNLTMNQSTINLSASTTCEMRGNYYTQTSNCIQDYSTV